MCVVTLTGDLIYICNLNFVPDIKYSIHYDQHVFYNGVPYQKIKHLSIIFVFFLCQNDLLYNVLLAAALNIKTMTITLKSKFLCIYH